MAVGLEIGVGTAFIILMENTNHAEAQA